MILKHYYYIANSTVGMNARIEKVLSDHPTYRYAGYSMTISATGELQIVLDFIEI